MASDPFFIVAALACLAVLGILAYGISGFAKGGSDNGKKANKIMQWRIGMQFLAVVLILLFVAVQRMGGN
ncbi:MAG: twin transmembrane helix small protein [Pseudomonadota bacterium]